MPKESAPMKPNRDMFYNQNAPQNNNNNSLSDFDNEDDLIEGDMVEDVAD